MSQKHVSSLIVVAQFRILSRVIPLTNDDLLSIKRLRSIFVEIWIKIQNMQNMQLKMSHKTSGILLRRPYINILVATLILFSNNWKSLLIILDASHVV